MKRYNITVNGKAYDVAVEEVDGSAAPVAAAPAPAVPAGTPPEVIAAISGAISMVMNDDEMIAAMAAAIQHAGGGVAVVRIKKPSTLWAQTGRLSLMNKRQECY